MFQELMALLSQRVLIVTLSRLSDEETYVTIIPKPLQPERRGRKHADQVIGRYGLTHGTWRTSGDTSGAVCGLTQGSPQP